MILHIPHAHPIIPDKYKNQYLIDEATLEKELRQLTDWYTHELFQYVRANVIDFPFSRYFVDVERFANDLNEPMAQKGMGRFYTKTIDGKPLRKLTPKDKKTLEYFYNDHHERLRASVVGRIKTQNKALIVDCHSFPDKPLNCNLVQDSNRPDICLGYDEYHFSEKRINEIKRYFEVLGYRVEINTPFAGSIVPADMYCQLDKVQSVMIEVNRKLYMDEVTLEKNDHFITLKNQISVLLHILFRDLPIRSSYHLSRSNYFLNNL